MNQDNLTKEQAIYQLEHVYGGKYLEDSPLDLSDQLFIAKTVGEGDQEYDRLHGGNASSVLNGSGTYKREIKSFLTESKLKVITLLNTYTHRTPYYQIALALEELFQECDSKEGHWTYIAEHYAPRAIIRVLNQMSKKYGPGWMGLNSPAAYFTQSLKFRKTRKVYRGKGGRRE